MLAGRLERWPGRLSGEPAERVAVELGRAFPAGVFEIVERRRIGVGHRSTIVDVTPDEVAARRARMTVRRFNSHAEADRHDLEYWMEMPAADRVALVWQLSVQAWQFKEPAFHESRLRRDVVRTLRGGR